MIDRAIFGPRQAGELRGQFRAVDEPLPPASAGCSPAAENADASRRGSFLAPAFTATVPPGRAPDALMLAILDCLKQRP